jgi:molybdopterin-guanine dinucleotide biosynthesis protein A
MESIAASEITGLILAGGRAQRMGGIDKGLIPFKGIPLIESSLNRLKPQVHTILINANRNHSIYSLYGYPVLADEDDSFSGPLAGFMVGLKIGYASSQDTTGKIWAQPVFCLMHKDLLGSLKNFLESGERKIDRWFAQENAYSVLFPKEKAFTNANTPEELAQLESLADSY